MTYFPEHDFTTNELAGAVAEATLRDLRINNFTFSGIPAIVVLPMDGDFVARLTLGEVSKEFSLTQRQAIDAAHRFKKGRPCSDWLFSVAQKAIQGLECVD